MKKTRLGFMAAILAGMLGAVTVIAQSPAVAISATSSATANWLQYRSDSRRSGFNPNETQITPANVGALRLLKIVGFPFGGSFDGPRPPLVYGNTLYTVATSFRDPDHHLVDQTTVYALNPVTGATKWTQTIGCRFPAGDPAISTTAHMLVVPMRTGCGSATGSGSVFGFDPATGSQRWGASTETYPASIAELGGTLIERVSGPGGDEILSREAATGSINWFYFDDQSDGFGDPSVGGGQVYFRDNVGGVPMLTALDPTTGARLWTKGSATGDPTLGDGRVYVDCDKGICSYNQSGTLRWSFASGRGEVALANGTVYVACNATDLCALDGTTGALKWSADASHGSRR